LPDDPNRERLKIGAAITSIRPGVSSGSFPRLKRMLPYDFERFPTLKIGDKADVLDQSLSCANRAPSCRRTQPRRLFSFKSADYDNFSAPDDGRTYSIKSLPSDSFPPA
jgi:hypothetical protein